MKFRNGFVTNSSSTSYVIKLKGETRGKRTAKHFAKTYIDVLRGAVACMHSAYVGSRDGGYNGCRIEDEYEQLKEEIVARFREHGEREKSKIWDERSPFETFFAMSKENQVEEIAKVMTNEFKWPKKAKLGDKISMNVMGNDDETSSIFAVWSVVCNVKTNDDFHIEAWSQ